MEIIFFPLIFVVSVLGMIFGYSLVFKNKILFLLIGSILIAIYFIVRTSFDGGSIYAKAYADFLMYFSIVATLVGVVTSLISEYFERKNKKK